MKKALILIFTVLCLVLALVACNNGDNTPPETVTVSFDCAGGGEIAPVIVEKGKTMSAPSEPSKLAYDFVGWYLNGVKWSFDSAVNEDMTLVAMYEQKVTPTLSYEELDSYIVITGCGNEETELYIPSEYNGKPVKAIAKDAFKDNDKLTIAYLSDSIKTISKSAFEGCDNLKTVKMPSGLESLESKAFASCVSLTEINLPNGIKSIGQRAFKGCTLLTKINLPNSIDYLGEDFILDCPSVTFEEYENCKYIDNWLIECTKKDIRLLTIRDGTVGIYSYAFYYFDNLRNITIPSTVKYIGSHAFFFCYNVTVINLSAGLEYIGMYAFYRCQKATSIVIPESVDTIGMKAFEYCVKLTINCEAEAEKEGFEPSWNGGREVIYGYEANQE